MANTVIQVKRSTVTNQPSGGSLSAGEIAYSYSSNVFFLGSSAGNDVLAIGGKFYVDKTNSAYTIAAAAFDAANSGSSAAAAFDKANSANYLAFLASTNASAAFLQANNVGGAVTTANNTAIAAFTQANNVGGAVTTANNTAIAAFAKANGAETIAIAAFDAENVTRTISIAAFGNANSKFSSTGGIINGDVQISGNLSVTGNTIWTNVSSFIVNDPLIYLAGNNYVSDIVDIGFVANYVNATGSNVHTGFFRDAGNKEYYIFEGYNQEPYNNVIDPAANGFTISVLNATLRTSNIILGGTNTINWITGAFDKANSAYQTAGDGYNVGVAAFIQANNVGGAVTTANNIGIAAFTQANAVAGAVTTANSYAVAAFTQANNVGGAVTTANNIATSAFATANAASAQAANADFITSGTLVVGRGGTGLNTVTTNGVLFGNTTGALKVTAAGTEGQVLQASSTGVPSFAMLDGGSF
jgi:hypothetical protein